jgi:hypothetical protein
LLDTPRVSIVNLEPVATLERGVPVSVVLSKSTERSPVWAIPIRRLKATGFFGLA